MGYRVSGILKLPDGTPANNAEIEFISRKNFSPLVQELKSNIRCSATGAYDVTLEYGEYAVIVYPGGTYPAALGTITLASDTAAGKDLPTLLQQSGWQPATPEYIQQIAAWLAEANASAASSSASASAAKVSETNAKSSENAALSSKNSAASSASTATTKATEAASSASAALASKNAAATSETNALSSKNSAAASASTATSAASSATSSASAAAGSESTALSAATRAEQAAQTVTAALIDAGPYNAASGVLPTPSMSSGIKRSSIWKVTGSGTAGGIELSIGDSLVYTASDNSYYKIDNTESFAETLQAAALPFPDVWIPLNDSLGMLAGFGDEVKVGDYTVATQATLTRNSGATLINKSGALVSAGVNEPRFEKDGLLVEGQSTNLVLNSNSDFRATRGAWSYSQATGPDLVANSAHKFVENEENSSHRAYANQVIEEGKTYVVSFFVKAAEREQVEIYVTGTHTAVSGTARFNLKSGLWETAHQGVDVSSVALPNGWYRLSAQFTATKSGTNVGAVVLQTCLGGSYLYQGDGASGIYVFGFQMEQLPFATSYIPTNGAAATRAADLIIIPRMNNECVEWYSGADPITSTVTNGAIALASPEGKPHLRNVRGFFAPLTTEQKKALK